MISSKEREKLKNSLLTAKLIHSKRCLVECICGKDEIMFQIDDYTELVTAERVRFAEKKAEDYGYILQRMGANKCATCKDYMAEADEVYCDSCDDIIHMKCAGYTTTSSAYDDDGTVLCVECKKKEDERIENEPIEMDPWGDPVEVGYEDLPF